MKGSDVRSNKMLKNYYLDMNLADAFAEACKARGEHQSHVMARLMERYIADSAETLPEAPRSL